MEKEKVLLCGIGKLENNYIREWVEHHRALGFDNIVLYDNNDVDGERFEEVISDYIESGYVILKDWRGRKLAQIPSYNSCYDEYNSQYDWIGFWGAYLGAIGSFIMEDDPKNMADIIINLYTDYSKLKNMSESGKLLIDKYFSKNKAKNIISNDII